MKFYLAARYSRHLEMQSVAFRLKKMGHEVTSRWIQGDHKISDQIDAFSQNARFAIEDICDLALSDIVVSFTDDPNSANGRGRGGRHVELGLAIAANKILYLVGPRENVFHYLKEVHHFDDTESFFKSIGETP